MTIRIYGREWEHGQTGLKHRLESVKEKGLTLNSPPLRVEEIPLIILSSSLCRRSMTREVKEVLPCVRSRTGRWRLNRVGTFKWKRKEKTISSNTIFFTRTFPLSRFLSILKSHRLLRVFLFHAKPQFYSTPLSLSLSIPRLPVLSDPFYDFLFSFYFILPSSILMSLETVPFSQAVTVQEISYIEFLLSFSQLIRGVQQCICFPLSWHCTLNLTNE